MVYHKKNAFCVLFSLPSTQTKQSLSVNCRNPVSSYGKTRAMNVAPPTKLNLTHHCQLSLAHTKSFSNQSFNSCRLQSFVRTPYHIAPLQRSPAPRSPVRCKKDELQSSPFVKIELHHVEHLSAILLCTDQDEIGATRCAENFAFSNDA